METVALIRCMCVFLSLVAKMRARFSGNESTLIFFVKLGKNASDTYGGDAMNKSNLSEWHKLFKKSSYVEITNEENAHHFL
jgi:hypothetical protein